MPIDGTTIVVLVITLGLVAAVVISTRRRRAERRREAALSLIRSMTAAVNRCGAQTHLSPDPFVFLDRNGVQGVFASQRGGKLHGYFVDTTGTGDARYVNGELLPRRPEGQARNMSLKPLGSKELHGEGDYPATGKDGLFHFSHRLNPTPQMRETETCDLCNKVLKPALEAELQRVEENRLDTVHAAGGRAFN